MELIRSVVQLLGIAVAVDLCAIGSLLLLLKFNRTLQEKMFVFIFRIISAVVTPHLVSFKKQLFQDLDKVESKDPELKKQGLFRILEIGVGEGSNLAYYPKNCRLISLEPSDSFYKHYKKNRNKYPDLVVEKFVKSGAEDMTDIPDGSVDVVACTNVLCSVQEPDKVLREIRRVLCKDGQFLLLEHVIAPPNTGIRILQHLLNPFWKIILAGCHLNRNTEEVLRKAGFSKLEVEMVNISSLLNVIQWRLFGKAVNMDMYRRRKRTDCWMVSTPSPGLSPEKSGPRQVSMQRSRRRKS